MIYIFIGHHLYFPLHLVLGVINGASQVTTALRNNIVQIYRSMHQALADHRQICACF